MSGWDRVWAARTVPQTAGSTLAGLMAADGLDTPTGRVEEAAWLEFVRAVAARVGLRPGDSVFEVGCGAGAFLYDLHRSGIAVSGLDRSPALVELARQAMPGARFEVADAGELDTAEQADAVVSCGVFLYFPSLEYARDVVLAMAAKARRAVAILDLPDLATREEALARRRELAGGEDAYAERYRGLEHLYFDRDWVAGVLREAGLVRIETASQAIAGYENGRHRFNAFGLKDG